MGTVSMVSDGGGSGYRATQSNNAKKDIRLSEWTSTVNSTPNRLHESTTAQAIKNGNDDIILRAMRGANLRSKNDIDLFRHRYRFGLNDPYDTLLSTREFLFFTKPDLSIMHYFDEQETSVSTTLLRAELRDRPFWKELLARYPEVIFNLQGSCPATSYGYSGDPFNNLLANTVRGNLEVPGLSSDTIDTPSNAFGVNYSYRGSSESGNDNYDFSLEFKDTRYLPVFMYFKAYEEYETLKKHGIIRPNINHILNKVIHDQFAIYKFLVDEDMETIIYWGKYWGVMPLSLPRDVFSSNQYDEGLSLSISFKAAFFDDMDPLILSDFNSLGYDNWTNGLYDIPIYNQGLHRVDTRTCTAARIFVKKSLSHPGGYKYLLKWRGRDKE